MTEQTIATVIVGLIAAIPPTLAALAALRQGRKNASASIEISKKADVIHDLTNSNLTAVKADLALARAKIERLEALVVAIVDRTPDTLPKQPTPPVADSVD